MFFTDYKQTDPSIVRIQRATCWSKRVACFSIQARVSRVAQAKRHTSCSGQCLHVTVLGYFFGIGSLVRGLICPRSLGGVNQEYTLIVFDPITEIIISVKVFNIN